MIEYYEKFKEMFEDLKKFRKKFRRGRLKAGFKCEEEKRKRYDLSVV